MKDSIVARIKKAGKNFEILVNPDNVIGFKQGRLGIYDLLASEWVFSDSKKGIKASQKEMKHIFGSDRIEDIAVIIMNEGIVQITADQKRGEIEQKKRRVVDIIRQNAINPQTGKPYPANLIEDAIREAKVKISEKPAESQIEDVLQQIRRIIPISYEIQELAVKIPVQLAGKSYGVLKQKARILAERHESDGSLIVNVELPAGLREDFERAIQAITRGEADIKLVKKR